MTPKDLKTIKLPGPAIVEPVLPPKVITDTLAVAAPTTSAEDDRKTRGQRNINLIWECTQGVIAVAVTFAAIWMALHGMMSELVATAFGWIVGTYFTRTNHTKIGGVGGTDSASR